MQTQKNIIMWPLNIFDINILIIITAVFSHLIIVLALRDVKVKIPPAVRKGEKAILKCSYDMEGDSIYSVKWYKGRREFYRYTPKETPPMKIFPVAGVRIEHRLSNESQLTLNSVGLIASGKYSCEVSADAPSFHTLISSGELEVVEIPSQKPIITGIRSRYRVGEIVRGNCTSRNSKPAANLTWTINDHEANPSLIRQHKPIHDLRSGGGGGSSGNGGLIIGGNSNGGVGGDLEISTSQIQFVITPQHFYRGKLKIRCAAHIHDIYWQSTEKSIEEERPKIISVSNGNSVNLIQTYPYDQYSLQDDDIADKKDYVTHIQGDMSSLNSGTVSLSSTILLSYIKTTATAAAATTALTTTSSGTLKSILLFMILCSLYYTIHNCTSHVYGGGAGSGGILTILSVCYLILCNTSNNSNSIIILHRILLFIFQLQYNTSNYNDNNDNDDNMQIVNIS